MNRILKFALLGVIGLLLLSAVGSFIFLRGAFKAPPNQLVRGEVEVTIPFRWEPLEIGGVTESFGAMLLPVTIPGLERRFWMQFDLGAPYSLFYYSVLDEIQAHCNGCLPIIVDEEGKLVLDDFSFQVGDLPVTGKRVTIREYGESGIDWDRPDEVTIIGTLGADLIDGRIVVIDYPAGLITLALRMPSTLESRMIMESMRFRERRVLLPVVVAGVETTVLFDTGTSAFELLTDRRTWSRLARVGAREEVLPVSSWDDTLRAHRIASDAIMELGGSSFPLGRVTFIEGTSLIQNLLMRFSGMSGMIGNRLLVDRILVMDLVQERFAVIEPVIR